MHEVSMALSVIHIVEQAGQENNLRKISKVRMRRGTYSGIMEDSFLFAFDQLKMKDNSIDLLKDAVVEFIDAGRKAECMSCHKNFELNRYHKKCPYCNGVDLSYPNAYDFYVESIEGE